MKQLTVKDLMVGDYLLWNNKPYRVTQVSSMDAGLSDFSFMLENGEEDCGEPIPLKRIHLTKNGFKAIDETDVEFVYRDGYEIKVEFDEGYEGLGFPSSIFLLIGFAEKDLTMPIEYVHELQNAMRLMGCNKEIIL